MVSYIDLSDLMPYFSSYEAVGSWASHVCVQRICPKTGWFHVLDKISHGPKITWVEIFLWVYSIWNYKYILSGFLLTGWIKRLLLCLRYLWVWWSNLRMWRLRWCLMPEQHGALWPSDRSLELMSSYGYQAALL